MQKKFLHSFFNPQSIAVIGASPNKEHVGYAIMRNLIVGEYAGRVYPVNPHPETVFGSKTYPSIKDIPEPVDLAIVGIHASAVPEAVEQCGKANIHNVVVISSGFKESGSEGNDLYTQLKKSVDTYQMNMMGPNCLGFIRPDLKLNASFAGKMAKTGNIAFISQSGALCTSVLDWSIKENIGFSYFVSIGEMIDIGIHDLIDYFGNDPYTDSILIYMETLSNARRFLSAARAYARTKPIVVLKVGKSQEGAKAALSHTGSLAGNDKVFDAAFKRVGMLRVNTIDELFDYAEILVKRRQLFGNKLAIITNAGGPGVIATDYLIEQGGELADLSGNSKNSLHEVLPQNWSKSNPVDILGDADPKRFRQTIDTCLADENINALLVIVTPQAMTDPSGVAKEIVDAHKNTGKTILTSFMGGVDVSHARTILERENIPTYSTPEQAVKSFVNMYTYQKNIELLYQTPATIPHAFIPRTEENKQLIDKVTSEGRFTFDELEAKQFLSNYGMPTPPSITVKTAEDAAVEAEKIGFPVAMKILSPDILHKTEVRGYRLDINSKEEARLAFDSIMNSCRQHKPDARIHGMMIEKMIPLKYELFIGCTKDPIFGPAIAFGMGGVTVELYKDMSIGLPPMNMALAKRVIEDTKINKLLEGYRGMKGVDIASIQFLLYKFSYLVADFPQIKEIDINPFAVDENGGYVLDAKVILDEQTVKNVPKPYSHLVISPYPKEYIRPITLKNGMEVILRPILPEDEPMEAEMFTHFSEETQRFRFFTLIKDITHQLLIRYTQIDYDREIAIIAEYTDNGIKKMLGVVRLIGDAYNESAEFAIVVADPWQHLGLGSILMDYILEIAKKREIKNIYAYVLPDNDIMLGMLKKRGFTVSTDNGNCKAELNL